MGVVRHADVRERRGCGGIARATSTSRLVLRAMLRHTRPADIVVAALGALVPLVVLRAAEVAGVAG